MMQISTTICYTASLYPQDIAQCMRERQITAMLAVPLFLTLLKHRIERQARQRALESLGLAEFQAELDAIAEQEKVLEKREQLLHKAMLARVQGVPVEDVESNRYYSGGHHPDVENAIKRRGCAP